MFFNDRSRSIVHKPFPTIVHPVAENGSFILIVAAFSNSPGIAKQLTYYIMKRFLLVSAFAWSVGAVAAQCPVYSTNRLGSDQVKIGKSDGTIIYTTDATGARPVKAGKVENGKIYSTDRKGLTPVQKGKIEDGIVYSTDRFGSNPVKVGKIVGQTVFATDTYGLNATIVGKVEDESCNGGAALLLLLLKANKQ